MTTYSIPSSIDFQDLEQARRWAEDANRKRPWRSEFWLEFASRILVEVGEGARIVEVGSGPGFLADEIIRTCRPESYTLIDISEAMHFISRERLLEHENQLQFLIRDISKPDWTDGIGLHDAVVSMQAIHEVRHKTRIPSVVALLRSIVRPGGIVLLCDHTPELMPDQKKDLYLTAEEQGRALSDAGFESVRLIKTRESLALHLGITPLFP